MKLYIQGKEHSKDLLDSILNGPFKYGTVEVPGTPTSPASTRPRTYEDLTEKEKILEECDIRETNIVLQGLLLDVYTLVNHHTNAKEIWDRVKLLIEGTELSLQERESKLYNEFDQFTSEKRESIHSYYLRFAQLINDMNTIKMTIQKLQVNTKQHEVHANEVRMMRERFPDPLALVANSYNTPPYYNNHQPQYNPSQYHQQLSLIAQHFYTSLPQPQPYEAPVHQNQATIQDGRVIVQNVQGGQTQSYADCDEAPSASAVLMAKLSAYDLDVLSEYSKQPIFVDDTNIKITRDNNVISYEQYLQQNKNEVVQDTTSFEQQDAMIIFVIEQMSNQVVKCNAVNQENKTVNESLTAKLERYKEQVKFFAERQKFDFNDLKKHDPLSVINSEETLDLAKATRLKMNEKQNDQIVKEKRVNIKPIDYGSLNELYKHFVP
ncbi:hypothetical protein Tco_0467640 [Tanacetum coccineum]